MPADKTIRLKHETWRRLKAGATAFASSDRGTPDKAINAALDDRDTLHALQDALEAKLDAAQAAAAATADVGNTAFAVRAEAYQEILDLLAEPAYMAAGAAEAIA